MTLLLKLGGWITDHPKSAFALVFLAGGLFGVLAGRRMSPPQALQEEVRTSGAAFGREDLTRKTEEGPWSLKTWEFEPGGEHGSVSGGRGSPRRSAGADVSGDAPVAKIVQGLTAEGALVKFSIEEHGPTASETHASSESAQSTTQTLHLEQQGSLAAQWALSVGFENLLHDKALRLSVRRKLLGPIWLEGAFTPATRAVGVGLAVEF